ncbi:hypothetical protein GCM10027422_34400 [Hymenobacter arcticus]
MTYSHLSAGQVQVWKIATQILDEFNLNPTTTNEQQGAVAYQTLLDRFAQDSVIRQDYYTGCRIVAKQVANSYIVWLATKQRSKKISPGAALPIAFDRMDFHGSVNGGWELDFERQVYQGGVRTPAVTARAVLTLAQGATLYPEKIGITYFANSRIMQLTGGNHRLLAYKLLGIPAISLEKLEACQVVVYDDDSDEQLNKDLLCLEALERSPDPRQSQIVATGNEALINTLAATYGGSLNGQQATELYRFAEYDLHHHPLMPSYNNQNPLLDRLTDYAVAYRRAGQSAEFGRGWVERIFTPQISSNKLTDQQKELVVRLAAWRKGYPPLG